MRILTISWPDSLKSFVDAQARQRGHRTGSEYVCELIQKTMISSICAICS